MTSKHYGWQKAWRVDLTRGTCTHELGLQFDWAAARMPMAAATAAAPNGRPWFGAIVGGSDAAAAWLDAQPSIRDPRSKSTRLQRACREASEAWAAALAGRWRATACAGENRADTHPPPV